MTFSVSGAARLEREVVSLRDVEKAAMEKRPRTAASDPTLRRRSRGVTFKDREGHLELSLRGPKDQVVPELFAIARDENSPETASLALDALEGLLESPRARPVASAEERGWFNRGIQGFANVMGMEDARGEAPSAAGPDRAERLKTLDAIWSARTNPIEE